MASPAAAPASGGGSFTDGHFVYKHAIDELRKSLTCTICLRLLHEPFTTSCGHTFCYECLDRWFTENKSLRSCPDCRARIQQQPAQAFKVREMVSVLCKDERLLPTGETIEEHLRMSEEMTSLVETHRKAESGLFQGVFKAAELAHAIYEPSEDVWRCPSCLCELMDFCCPECELGFDSDGHPVTLGDELSVISTAEDTDVDESLTSARFPPLVDVHFLRETQQTRRAGASQFAGALDFHRSLLAEQRRFMRSTIRQAVEAHANAPSAGSGHEGLGEEEEEEEEDDDYGSDGSDISDLIDDDPTVTENSSSDTDDADSPRPFRSRNWHLRHNVSTLVDRLDNDTESSTVSEDPEEVWRTEEANFSDLDEDPETVWEEGSASAEYGGDEEEDVRASRRSGANLRSTSHYTGRGERHQPMMISSAHDEEDESEGSNDQEDEEEETEGSEESDSGEENSKKEERFKADNDDDEEESDEDDNGEESAREEEQVVIHVEEGEDDAEIKPVGFQHPRKRTRVVLSDDDSDSDDDEVRPPNSKRSRQASPQTAAAASTATLRSAAESSSSKDGESDEDFGPIQAGRDRSRRTGRPGYSSSILGRYGSGSRGRRPFSVRA